MADIALVSLALDSTAVVAGEKQATRALHLVETAMQRAEKQSAQLNSGLNANLKRSGDAFKGLGESASRAGAALSGLGGPVGRVGGEIANLGGQLETLVGSMGLVGGAAAAGAVGVVALGSALVKLTLQGVAVSDEMADIAESTGLTIDQVQRLGAAARLSGEDIGLIERSFRTFQSAIQSAVQDPSSDAAKAFTTLGINAKKAGEDVGTAFVSSIANLKQFSATTAGATAASEVFGRGIGSLIRTSDNLAKTLGTTRDELERTGVIATREAIEAAGRLDAKINELNNSWTVFTQNLAGTSVGAAIEQSLAGGITALSSILSLLQQIEKNPYAKIIVGGVITSVGGAYIAPGQRRPGAGAPIGIKELPVSQAELIKGAGRGVKELPVAAKESAATVADLIGKSVARHVGGGARAAKETGLRVQIGREFDPFALTRPAIERMERAAQDVSDMFHARLAVDARDLGIELQNLGTRVERITAGVPLAIPGAPPGVGGTTIPGELQPRGPRPQDIRTIEQDRLDQQFELIFDDFLVSILTAQKTLSGAFSDLALNIADTFAIELTKAMRESFITPMVRGMTELLQEGLASLFGGLKGFGGSGVKGFFGGLLKGIGTIFGGFFATGGTLGPGKFGIAGERGPELLFSGNQPLHIAPVSNVGGSGVISVNMNFAIAAPTGEVSQRTQDQIADSAMRGMERAQRLRGAR